MREHTQQTAMQKRAAHPDLVPIFSLETLKERLSFRFPVPEDVPPSPKRQHRSRYRYLGFGELADLAVLVTLTAFEVALRLIDFSSLRDYLAAHTIPAASGARSLLTPSPCSCASACGGN